MDKRPLVQGDRDPTTRTGWLPASGHRGGRKRATHAKKARISEALAVEAEKQAEHHREQAQQHRDKKHPKQTKASSSKCGPAVRPEVRTPPREPRAKRRSPSREASESYPQDLTDASLLPVERANLCGGLSYNPHEQCWNKMGRALLGLVRPSRTATFEGKTRRVLPHHICQDGHHSGL